MKYYAFSDGIIIKTDDYNQDEIKKGIHLEHILSDMKKNGIQCLEVFDEKLKHITRLEIVSGC